nr:MauE/DoxX family redox-associated membrane protein [uncultured Desulfobulbus sp.]
MTRSESTLRRRLPFLITRLTVFVCIRWVLAAIFIYSGAIKLFDPSRFAQIISGFGLLPKPLLMPTAILLPLTELIAGIGLLFNKRGSLTAITLMLVLFMGVLSYGISLGLDIDCGCFGPEDPEYAYKGLKTAMVRDSVMMIAILCLFWQRRHITQASSLKPGEEGT